LVLAPPAAAASALVNIAAAAMAMVAMAAVMVAMATATVAMAATSALVAVIAVEHNRAKDYLNDEQEECYSLHSAFQKVVAASYYS
jgi:predicted membrane-bound spermidine synthase